MYRATLIALLLVALSNIGAAFGSSQDQSGKSAGVATRITEREVLAVQNALLGRGYLNKKPSGVLDRETGEALRGFQKDQGLDITGGIDAPTIEKLGLTFPIPSDADERGRRRGIFPKIGYAIKDGTTTGGKAIGRTSAKVGRGTKSGAKKTAEATGSVAARTGEAAKSAGDATVDGVKSVGQGAQQVSSEVADATVGRSDADIHVDVRKVLNAGEKTRLLRSEVNGGRVTIITSPGAEDDLSPVVSKIRKVSGVKSVMVLSR
jgi:hypothetical protein